MPRPEAQYKLAYNREGQSPQIFRNYKLWLDSFSEQMVFVAWRVSRPWMQERHTR
jgi:hypothetical protein